jgi:hypothetical protein
MVNVFSTEVTQVEGLLLQTTRGYETQSVQLTVINTQVFGRVTFKVIVLLCLKRRTQH